MLRKIPSVSLHVFLALSASLLPAYAENGKPWTSPEETAALTEEMRDFFDGMEVRYPGSPGNLAMEERISGLFEAAAAEDESVRNGAIKFRSACFEPGRATLTPEGGEALRIYAMAPGLARPGNFTESDFTTRLISMPDADAGSLAKIKGLDLENSVVLLDFDAVEWRELLRFGVRGFVFVETEECRSPVSKVPRSEIRVPRYYIRAEEGRTLREAIGAAGGELTVRIQAEPSIWKNKFLRSPWVYIPGADKDLAGDVVLFVAQLDTACVVPELAEGGRVSANLFQLIKLFESFKKHPPARTVMLAAVNARTLGFQGDRHLAWHCVALPYLEEGVRDVIAGNMRLAQVMVDHYTNLTFESSAHSISNDQEYIIGLRNLVDDSIGKNITVKAPVVAMAKRAVNRIRDRKVQLVRSRRELLARDPSAHAKAAEYDKELETLAAEKNKYVDVLTLFNKIGIRTLYGEISDESRQLLQGFVRDVIERNRAWLELDRQDMAVSTANSAIRDVLAGGSVSLAIMLDMSWHSNEIAFDSADPFGLNGRWGAAFGKNTVRISGELAGGEEKQNLLRDTLTNVNSLEQLYYAVSSSGAAGIYHAAMSLPAFALGNTFAPSTGLYTPHDSVDRLDPGRIGEIIGFMDPFLRAVLADRAITAKSDLPRYANRNANNPARLCSMWGVRIRTFEFDEYAANTMPSLPVPNSLVVLGHPGITANGIVAPHIALTDERASAQVRGLYFAGRQKQSCNAYRCDEDFRTVSHTIDAGEVHDRVSANINPGALSRTLAMFSCREFPVYTRADPSMVSAQSILTRSYHVLSASQNASPRHYGFMGYLEDVISDKYGVEGAPDPMAIYIEPHEKFKVLTNYKRTALNPTDTRPDGIGYGDGEELGPDFYAVAARDMSKLNAFRRKEMRGVIDELTSDFCATGDAALKDLDAAASEHDYTGYCQNLYKALGAHVKAYERMVGTTNDMLKAVVFYMALLLPFCFFLQRLVFKFVKIEYQMAAFALTFVTTFVVFRLIHPAFRIAEAPEAMFVAFVMFILGAFVIHILHGRFEGEMQLLFHTYSGVDISEVAYTTAGQQAMMIGVNNMKRRRVRTVLTTATIVLVTFTMLSFSSISQKMSPTVVPRGKAPPYTGIMYHWPGQMMGRATEDVLLRMFEGKAEIIRREWTMSPRRMEGQSQVRIPMRVLGKPMNREFGIDAILWLSVKDDGFLGRIPMLEGSRFFSADDAHEAIIPAAVADVLGLSPKDIGKVNLVLRDREYLVVGILDDEQFRTIRDINGAPLVPIQVGTFEAAEVAEIALMDSGNDESGIEYVDSASFVILPIDAGGGQTYSLSIKFADDEPIWPHVSDLLTATKAKFFVSSRKGFKAGGEDARKLGAGVYYVGTGYRTSIGGLSKLIVPLLIASTIILNTMLGSVYERKSEIAIYNAVGLNPTHIGMFFLAEALVYSIIGAVGGYLIGQILSIALSGIIEGINLNFSSLSVVYVIAFTIAIVLLSTLYPAAVATREAIPSGKRKWSMPDSADGKMSIVFPFIYQDELVPGVMNYLEKFFDAYTEASVGDLIASLEGKSSEKDDEGRKTYELAYHLALAPYDLGVTQKVRLRAAFDDHIDSNKITMFVDRVSGQDSNWHTTNKPFLEQMRQYLMHWRNLDKAQHSLYVEQGKASFEESTG